LAKSNVTVKTGILAIPSSSSLIFTISLPDKITEEKLASVVPLEARKYIPVPITEVSLDWFVLPKEADSSEVNIMNNTVAQKIPDLKTEVLVVAIHNDILGRYQEILKDTEIHSDSFEMEIFSNIRASFSHDLSPVLLMDFGASKTKLSIIEEGVVHVFHVVNRGGADITKNIVSSMGVSFAEAEKLKRSIGLDANSNPEVADIIRLSIDYILSDTNSVVFAYQKKYNKNISKVILTGGGSLTKGLIERAVSNFHTEVIYSNPFSKTEAPAFLLPILEISGPEFSVAVGLALRQLF
jgi:type IV pilus assembly protein PilM